MLDRPFIRGLELCELFYQEAVRPILRHHFPNVSHSAALLGSGSEVLGFDTPQSTDHDWGPRVLLFLGETDHEAHREEIDRVLRRDLPREFHGYATDLACSEATNGAGQRNHSVRLFTVRGFFIDYLNNDPDERLCAVDWLTFPQQHLRTVVAGRVFHDGLGQLEPLRARLHYYPHDVWLYLLAAQWRRVSQEEAFMGRCGQVGDDLGSRLLAARLVRDLMTLCFLMEQRYTPYIKWFGTAFAELDCAPGLLPILRRVLDAGTWQERETHLARAYACVARMHNDLGITRPLPVEVSGYFNRPFLVIHATVFADAIREAIDSEEVRALPVHLGSIDQFVDSTDVLSYPRRFDRLKLMYRDEGDA